MPAILTGPNAHVQWEKRRVEFATFHKTAVHVGRILEVVCQAIVAIESVVRGRRRCLLLLAKCILHRSLLFESVVASASKS